VAGSPPGPAASWDLQSPGDGAIHHAPAPGTCRGTSQAARNENHRGMCGPAPRWLVPVSQRGSGSSAGQEEQDPPSPATSKANKREGSQRSPIVLPLFPVRSRRRAPAGRHCQDNPPLFAVPPRALAPVGRGGHCWPGPHGFLAL